METPIGERFARAIAEKDAAGLAALLSPNISFRALTPDRFWEGSSPAEVDDAIFGHWFAPAARIEAVEVIENDVVVDRERVGYRFRVAKNGQAYIVEQQAYLGVEDERIVWLRIMCAGYQPVPK